MATIGRMVVEMTANTARYRRDLEQARSLSGRAARQIETSFRSVERSIGSVVTGMLSFRNILGIALGTGVIGLAIRQATSFADALDEQSQRLGINVTSLQELQHAARLSGASTEQFEVGLKILNQRLGEVAAGEKGATAFFAGLGLRVTDTAGRLRSTDEVLGDFADTIAATESPAVRTRMAIEAFGRSGTALIPMLSQGRAGLAAAAAEAQRLGLVLDEHAIREVARLQDEFDRLAAVLQTTLVRAVLALRGPLEALTGWLGATAQGIKFLFDAVLGADVNLDFEALNTRLSQFRALLFDATREREALIQRGLAETSQEVKIVDQQLAALQARIREIEAERAKRPPRPEPVPGMAVAGESLADFLKRSTEEMRTLDDAIKTKLPEWEEVFTRFDIDLPKVDLTKFGDVFRLAATDLAETFALDFQIRLETALGEIDPNELFLRVTADPILVALNEQLEEFRRVHAVGAASAAETLQAQIGALNQAIRAGVADWDFFGEEGRERLIGLGEEAAQLQQRLAQALATEDFARAGREIGDQFSAGLLPGAEGVAARLQAVEAAARRAASAFGPLSVETQTLVKQMEELRRDQILGGLYDEIRRVDLETQMFGQSAGDAQRQIGALKSAIIALREEGLAPTDQAVQALRGQLLELERVEAIKDTFKAVFAAVDDGISSTIRGVLQGTQTMEDAFDNMARNIAISLVEHVIRRGLTQVMDALLALSGPLISAGLGGLFGAPATVPATGTTTMAPVAGFQHGGIVRRPTLALMGEAGDEAIIPLDRLDEFGGDMNLTVIVENHVQGAQVTASQSRGPDGRQMLRLAVRRALGDMSATGELDGILRPFGAGRRGVSR